MGWEVPATFYGPQGVAVDSSGNVYVADAYNNTIRLITSAGVVTTLSGAAGMLGSADGVGIAARFNGPNSIAVASSGNVYVADTGNNTIRLGQTSSALPPSLGITSLTATPNPAGIGQIVQFVAAASLTNTTISWNFGDGSAAGMGATVTHAFAGSGIFTVTIMATNGTQTASTTVSVSVSGPLVGTGTNSSGSIFSDSFIAAYGSIPMLTNAANPDNLAGVKITAKLNFAKPINNDSFVMGGQLSIPDAFVSNGAKLALIFGNFIEVFTLDQQGKAKSGNDQVSVAIKSKKGVVAAQTSKFSFKLNKDSLQAQLAPFGLANQTISKAPVTISAQIVFANALNIASVSEHYSAKQGKTGNTSK